MSAKVIADVLRLGTRYAENGNNDYIAYRYSDLKQALVELVKATQQYHGRGQGQPPQPSTKERELTGAFTEAVRDAIAGHHRAGRAVPIRRDGKLTWVGPDDLVLQDLHDKIDDIFADSDDIEIIEDV